MMKKYICYILPVFLLLPILGALGVWSQKNNMQIGLRKTADGEFDVTGDQLQAAYVKSDVLTDRTNTVDIQISPVFDEHIKQNSIENPGFDQPDDMEITHMISGVEAVSYRLSLLDPQAYGKNKQEDIAFEVRWKQDKLSSLIRCDYFDNDPKGSLSCSLTGDDLYQNARASAVSIGWRMAKAGALYHCHWENRIFWEW